MKPKAARGSFLGRLIRRLFWLSLIGIVAVVVGLGALLWYYGRGLPSVASLRYYNPPQVTRVVDRHGAVIDEVFTERRTVVPISRVPRVLVLSVLAAEDADFYRHQGLDYPGLIRAFVRALITGRVQGTSTITQQIVKNLILSPERSLARKVRELILARRIEQEFSKEEILGLYLNSINYGHGRYGVQEASQFYFGKNVQDLSLAEASLLAGVPQSPTHLSPRAHPEAARRRQLFVLGQLESKRAQYWPDLTVAEIAAARDATVQLVSGDTNEEHAPEVMQLVREQLRSILGRDALLHGAYVVHTTIDLALERAAREALRKGLHALDERHDIRPPFHAPQRARATPARRSSDALRVGRSYDAVVTRTDDATGSVVLDIAGHAARGSMHNLARYNPDHLTASRFFERGARIRVTVERIPPAQEQGSNVEVRIDLGPEGAILVIDPRTRDILAMIGGYERTPGYNRAVQATRQPGSAFKPIVYGLAIQSRRFTPATLVLDAPEVFDQWRPQNYETWNYQGAIRLREAVAQSVNLVAIRVIQDVTPAAAVDFARKLGITSALEPTLALSLGASDVKPIELVNAYATFAAGGMFAQPRLITRIVGPDGRDIALPAREPAHPVMTPAEAYILTSMLTSVVQTGTATGARRLQRAVAGKTGTSNEARDAWFVGYTPDFVAGVWIGYDDYHRSLGRRESGGRAAVPVWLDVMQIAEHNRPVVDFPMPSGVVTARIDPATGLLAYEGEANAIDEVFLEGTAPTESAPASDIVDTNTFLLEQLAPTTAQAPASDQ
ncbi:MAG: PBP1A family penicillin-binding protein [Sandaracinaceae bacterium]|nr:PBP1A family penicillin-binding protein [Sandaracinaceae bacterium]